MLDRIERDVRFEGRLTADQRARMLEIADRCRPTAPDARFGVVPRG